MPDETKVTFSLYIVLSFLTALGILISGYLNAGQKEIQTKQQEICERVVKLETQYTAIIDGQKEMTRALERLSSSINNRPPVSLNKYEKYDSTGSKRRD